MSAGIDPGCVRIRLALNDGRVTRVDVASERPSAASVLPGRPADQAVRLVPLLFALCGKAQGRAASLALAAARGDARPPQLDPDIVAEAMREHLWRVLLDLPVAQGGAAMHAEFAAAVGWIGKDEHARVLALLGDPRVVALEQSLAASADFPPSGVACLPPLDALASARHWPRIDAEFCGRPHWQGGAAETGAFARRGGPAQGTAARWLARIGEMRDWATGTLKVGAAGTASSVTLAPGVGRALVETARGLLMHEIRLEGEQVAEYRIVAPTEWNFHPRGVLPAWLAGLDATDLSALRAAVARAVAALDPCVRWELEIL